MAQGSMNNLAKMLENNKKLLKNSEEKSFFCVSVRWWSNFWDFIGVVNQDDEIFKGFKADFKAVNGN